ncbi:MAG: mutL [Clostridiales bacterium]|nr:mutL [Clostridiales bacterium]
MNKTTTGNSTGNSNRYISIDIDDPTLKQQPTTVLESCVASDYVFKDNSIKSNKAPTEITSSIQNSANESSVISVNVNKVSQPNNTYEQVSLTEVAPLLSKSAKASHRIIGQLFKTYWLVEFEEKLYIIDQHAAHERVLYEVFIKSLKERTMYSQQLMPPILVSLSMREADTLRANMNHFEEIGFEIESFGGKDYAIKAVPGNLFNIVKQELFIEILDTLNDEQRRLTAETIFDKIAKLSCKAAVKGNNHLSEQEIKKLIDDLLELDNPYTCPHGRPTIISMTQYEIEKKFKRIQ